MRLAVFLTILCLGAASAAPLLDPSLDAEWQEWKTKFGRTYSPDEEGRRRAVWEDIRAMIQRHNKEYEEGKHSFTMGLNQFADMTNEEFRKQMSCFHMGTVKEDERHPKGLLEWTRGKNWGRNGSMKIATTLPSAQEPATAQSELPESDRKDWTGDST